MELVFELQLERLQHLLDFGDLGLTVQHRFNLCSTRLLVQRGHGRLLIHLRLESLVKFVEGTFPFDLVLELLEFFQQGHTLLARLLLQIVCSLLHTECLILGLLDLLEQVRRLLLEAIEHRLDMLILIHVNLVTVLAQLLL